MAANQGPQSSRYNTPQQNAAQEAARKALAGGTKPTSTEAAKEALGVTPSNNSNAPSNTANQANSSSSRRSGGGGHNLPMSTPTNVTPSAAAGQTMESVKAQSYNPATDVSKPIQFTNQQLQQQAQTVMQGNRNLTMQSAIVPYQSAGKAGDFERGYGKEYTRFATPTERSQFEQIGSRVTGTNQYAFTRSGRGTIQTKEEVSIGQVRSFQIAQIENKAQSIAENTYKQESDKLLPLAQTKLDNAREQLQKRVDNGEITSDRANQILQGRTNAINKEINEQATASAEASLKSNPVYAQVQKQYETTAKKYGISQDIYGKTYFKDLEKTGIERGREQTKEALQVVASIVPPLRPLLIGQAIKEQQKAPIIVEDISRINLKNIENYPTKTSPEAQKLLLLGAGSSLLEAPSVIKGIGREINIERIQQLNKMKGINVGLRQESELGFIDVLFTKRVGPEARLDIGTLVKGKEIAGGNIASTSETKSVLTYYDFLSGKPISIYQEQQGAALSKIFEQQGKLTPSISTLRTRQTVDFVVTPKGKGYIGEFNVFTNKPFKTKVVGGVSQEKGEYILSLGGDLKKVLNDAEKGMGFRIRGNDFTILKKIGTKPEQSFEFGGGAINQATKTVSKPAPSLAQEINKLAQQGASEKAITKQGSKVIFDGTKDILGLNLGSQTLKTETKTKPITMIKSSQLLENLQSGEIKTKTISGLMGSTAGDNALKQSDRQLTGLVTGIKTQLEQPQEFKQTFKPVTTTTPKITPREITGGGFDFGFPPFASFGGIGSGFKEEPKKLSKKKKKQLSAYTSNLLSAAFQGKPVKVTKKQLKKLNEAVFSGAEFRPVLELVSDKQFKKALKSVSF